MTSQIKKTAYRLLLGVLLISFTVASCNNKKDKKEEPATGDTLKPATTEPTTTPTQTPDSTGKVDTLGDKPVKPGE